MIKGWQVFSDGTLICRCYGYHSRLCGNVLLKPLDSGLRRNDEGTKGLLLSIHQD